MRKHRLLTGAAVLLGILGAVLEAGLFSVGDVLVPRRHPLGIALVVLTAFCCVLFFLLTRKETFPGVDKETLALRLSRLESAVAGCYTLGMLSTRSLFRGGGTLALLTVCLGVVALAGLLTFALLPAKKRELRSLAMAAVCLFFCVEVLSNFRIFGTDPQIHDYIMEILAGLCLMCFSYHAAANARSGEEEKNFAFWRLMGIFCCAVALPRGGYVYATAMLFLLGATPVMAEAESV